MSKIKMRCIACGKWFQSANAKEVTCPDCMQKARKEKLASKAAPPTSNKTAGPVAQARPVAPPPKPKVNQGGTNQWLDTVDDVKVAQPDQPPSRPKLPSTPVSRDNRNVQGDTRGPGGPGNYRDERGPGGYTERGPSRGPGGYREHENRSPAPYRVGGGSGLPDTTTGPRPRVPMGTGFGYGPRPGEARPDRPRPNGSKDGKPGGARTKPKSSTPRPPAPPKPKREKVPPPQPFVPTAEQVTQVEERYLELATPSEFDGIRSQISQELGIPKKAVKKIIKDLRARQDIPSWWELQVYKGSSEELERIKVAYQPYLPIPPVGVHKKIADELELKPGIIYQAIKTIRQELNLPQYNDPALHGLEIKAKEEPKNEPLVTALEVVTPAAETPVEASTPAVVSTDGMASNTEDKEPIVTNAAPSPESTPAEA